MTVLFHPIFVHFPIAFCFLELLLLIFWAVKRDAAYRRFAGFTFRIAYGFMLTAMITGWVDAGGFRGLTGMTGWHFYAALAAFSVYTARAFTEARVEKKMGEAPFVSVLGAALGNILILLTAFLGGRLVYF